MNNETTMQDEFEISGLIVCYKRPMWVKCLKTLLVLNVISFCTDSANEFNNLAEEFEANGDTEGALEMSLICAQLSYFAEFGHGVSSLIPFLAQRQLVKPSIVGPDDLELYISRVFVLSRDLNGPEQPEFLLIVSDAPRLYVTEQNSLLAKYSGAIGSAVVSQEQLNDLCAKLTK